MAKTLAVVLAVSIAALLFAGCGGGESKWTDSKCAEIEKKIGFFQGEKLKGSGAETRAIQYTTTTVGLMSQPEGASEFLEEHPGIGDEFRENCEPV